NGIQAMRSSLSWRTRCAGWLSVRNNALLVVSSRNQDSVQTITFRFVLPNTKRNGVNAHPRYSPVLRPLHAGLCATASARSCSPFQPVEPSVGANVLKRDGL